MVDLLPPIPCIRVIWIGEPIPVFVVAELKLIVVLLRGLRHQTVREYVRM
jgi:hypothetical protein